MSHFLKKHGELYGEHSHLTRPWAAVTVRFEPPDRLVVQSDKGFGVVNPDVGMVPVPDRIKVVDSDGKVIEPTGKFLVSTETLDPFHLVADWFDP